MLFIYFDSKGQRKGPCDSFKVLHDQVNVVHATKSKHLENPCIFLLNYYTQLVDVDISHVKFSRGMVYCRWWSVKSCARTIISYALYPIVGFYRLHTGSPKKHETQKMTWGLWTDISERMKGHSINPNTEKITVMLLEYY